MSSLVVQIVTYKLSPHPYADRLMIAIPDGMAWNCCVNKEAFEQTNKAVYIPIDSMLSPEVAEYLNLPNRTENQYRIQTLKLRGVVSQGLMLTVDSVKKLLDHFGTAYTEDMFEIGSNIESLLNIEKYAVEYPESSDYVNNPPGMIDWTDVESYRSFSDVLAPNTEVVLTEKIHGKSWKAGWFESDEGERLFVGTKNACFKPDAENEYTKVARNFNVEGILKGLPHWIIFGEVYGPGVQKRMHYGLNNPSLKVFGVFNGARYLDYDEVVAFTKEHNLEMVPELYRGPWNVDLLELSSGKSYCDKHIREGFVILPIKEMFHEKVGRVILKVVSEDFLLKNYDE